jgi:hypothetical protein
MGEFDLVNESRSEMLRGVHSHFTEAPFSFRPMFQSNPPDGGAGGGAGGAGGEGGAGAAGSGGTGGAGGAGGDDDPDDDDDDEGDDDDPTGWDKTRAASTIKAQREEAKRLKNQLKEARRLAAEGQAAKDALDAAETAKLGEQERLQKAHDKEKERADNAERALKAERLNGAIQSAAVKLNAHDADAVARLIDQDQIEFDDAGKPQNVEKLVKALLEAKPYLKKPDQNGQVPGTPGANGGGRNGLDPDAKKAAEQGAAALVRESF